MTALLTVPLLAAAIASAFAIGAVLLVVLSLVPKTRAATLQLWPVFGSEGLILAAGVLPWLLPPPALLCVLIAMAGRIGFESGAVHGKAIGKDFRVSHAVILVGVSLASWLASTPAFLTAFLVLLGLAFAAIWLSANKSTLNSLACFAVFPLLPLAAFSHVASEPGFAPWIVLAFFLVEIFDSFSLLGGKLYGRTPLVPRLSPRKTWEGILTGAGATICAVFALSAWLGLPPLSMLLLGLIMIVSAVAGDLLGSSAKRRSGVKDYPVVISVQGGVLDIADAWLVAAPCVVAVAVILGWS